MAIINIPRIIVLNNKEQYLTTIDNSRKNSLHFVNDKLTIFLKNSAQMFEAKFLKMNEDAQFLTVGNKLVLNYKNENYMFTIVRAEEDEHIVQITALGIVLEASNSIRESYDANNYFNITEYIKMFDYEKMFTIYLNQLSENKLKLNFSEETLLQRIFTIADYFDAEIKLYPILNEDYSIKHFALDIYKKDSENQGIGSYHPEIRLRYGKDVSTIKRTVDIMDLKTAIKPIGNNGLNLIGYQVDIRDENNKQLYYSTEQSGYIYAPQARDMFPSNRTGNNSDDFYIEYTKKYDTNSQTELAKLALADLKVDSEPKISYEIDTIFRDLDIGDTIRIDDTGYTPRLMLEARLTKQEICFTNPIDCKLTFSNFVELKSEIDPALIAKMKELAEQNKVYNAQILTDNTVVFKNNQGETTLIARVLDGIKDITDKLTITWLKGDLEVGNGKNLRVRASDISGVETYRFNAFLNEKLIAQAQISVADVTDGVDGQPGADGENAINAYLTNENITLKADTQGNLKSGQLELASGQMVVVDGPNVVTSGVSYSIVNQTGCTATIDSNGNYRLTALTADSASVILRASYKGTALQKTFNVNKLLDAAPGKNGSDGQDGKSPIYGYLTNESLIITEGQWSKANGYFNVYQGTTQITNGVKFELVSQTDMTVAINADTGAYQVTECSDFGTAIFSATYNGVTIKKQLMAVMNKSGQAVVVSDKPPATKTVGMLWKNTGTNEGLLTDVTYYWTGSNWEVYLFKAENIKVTNLAALSSNIGTVKTGMIMSSDGSMSMDLDKKKIYMKEYNHYGDTHYYKATNPGLKYQFWLTPTMFKYQHLEQPEQSGYYESGYNDDGFYVSDRSQGVKLRSYGLDFGNSIVLSHDYVSTDYKSVNLPYGLTGKLRRVGKVVTLVIPRQVINWTAPTGDYLLTSETIPFGFRPIDEVTVMINRFGGAVQLPIALHIDSYGYTHLTSSGTGTMAFTGTCSWVTK